MHTIASPASQTKITSQLAIGDKVEVLAKNGKTYAMQITAIESAALVGHDRHVDKYWKIPYSEIVRIDYKRVSTGTKVGAAASGVAITLYVVAIAVVIAGMIALGRAIDDAAN